MGWPVGRTTPTTVSTTETTTPDSFLSQPGRPRELSQNCTVFAWSNRGGFMWGTTQSMLLDTLLQTPLRLEIREKTWALDRVCEVAFNLAPTFNATVEKAAYRIMRATTGRQHQSCPILTLLRGSPRCPLHGSLCAGVNHLPVLFVPGLGCVGETATRK